MNKILGFVWIIASIITIGNTVQANTGITDITNSGVQTITAWAQEQSIIADDSKLDHDLTRAQAAQLYLNIAKSQWGTGKIMELMSSNINTGCIFDDIQDHPYARVITTACQRGLLKGHDGQFQPDDKISPLESLVTLIRISHGAQAEDSDPRYQSYVNLALRKNIINQSDISMINTGSAVSSNQVIQRAYNATHDTTPSIITKIKQALTSDKPATPTITETTGDKLARDSDTIETPKSKRSWKWLWWIPIVLLLRALWKLLSRGLQGYNTARTITGITPSGVYDDLTIVEGIGPKVQQILYENDILTYDSLSRLTAGHISNIISPYGTTYESMNPVTWPRQAQLAKDAKRDELEIFKQELKKGT